jgi:hypothetical protein
VIFRATTDSLIIQDMNSQFLLVNEGMLSRIVSTSLSLTRGRAALPKKAADYLLGRGDEYAAAFASGRKTHVERTSQRR